jgi:uncharacterized protein (TIGR03790 family)
MSWGIKNARHSYSHNMMVFRAFIGLLFFLSLTQSQWLLGDAKRVVILANANSPQSVEVARYYAQKRQIPETNIIALKMPRKATISWDEYTRTIHNPLMAKLVERGWIEADPLHTKDLYGRERYQSKANKISYLVPVFGVPLKISKSPHSQQAPDNIPHLMKTDAAAVDSELSVLLIDTPHAIGPLKNPLFQNPTPLPALERSVIKVGRLDGRSAEDAKALVDRALEGEASPVWGRAYVDIQGKHAAGDQWMRDTAKLLQDARWDVVPRNEKGTFRGIDRFDAPFFYFGWYTENINGPFREPHLKFPPGAFAFHLHSFSASQLTKPTANWCAGLIQRGAAVTLGNVFEPTLTFSLYPHLFVEAILAGRSTGEAAFYAQPALSWQGILLGDPLYQPNLGDAVDNPSSPKAKGYALIRRLQGLQREGRTKQAKEIGLRFLKETPHLPLAWYMVHLSRQPDPTEALAILQGSIANNHLIPEQAGLIREVARYLNKHGSHAESLRLYRWLVDKALWSQSSYKQVLSEALEIATAANYTNDIEYFTNLQIAETPKEPQAPQQ